MSDKVIKHFNNATVFGRVDGVPTRKLSNEGKGKPFHRIKVICASHRGNVLAYGRIWSKDSGQKLRGDIVWDEKKAVALIDYLKKNPSAGVKLVGFFNQYDKAGQVLSNFTWYDWFPDKVEDPRAAFVLVGCVKSVSNDVLVMQLDRENNASEILELHALNDDMLRGLTEGDVVEAVGYLRSKDPEDEFGRRSQDSPIRPYIEELKIRAGEGGTPF